MPTGFNQPNPGDVSLVGGMLLLQQDRRTVAYEPDGTVRWSAALDAAGVESAYTGFWMWDGNLLVERNTVTHTSDEADGMSVTVTTIALDPATGAQRWRVNGYLQPQAGLMIADDGAGGKQIYGSLPSGLLWTMPAARTSSVDATAGAMLAVTDAGILTEYDLRTGAVRRSGRVELPRVVDGNDELQVQLFHDRIVLRAYRYDNGPRPVTQTRTYDRATLQPAASQVDSFDAVMECGPVLCGYAGEQTSVLDPATAAELWQIPNGEYPYWLGPGLLITNDATGSRNRLVDPRTGAELVSLNKWNPMRQRFPSIAPAAGPAWVSRFAAPGRTYFALLHADGLSVVGTLPNLLTDCQTDMRLLSCSTGDGRVAVWRINVE